MQKSVVSVGAVFSRIFAWLWRKPKKTILEHLENIEGEITTLQESRLHAIDAERRFLFRLVLYSLIIFCIFFIFVYYYFWPIHTLEKCIFASSLFIYPALIAGLRYASKRYFFGCVKRSDARLKLLGTMKQKLLQEVMEKETFNKAQQILQRFEPSMIASASPPMNLQARKETIEPGRSPTTMLRQRKPSHLADEMTSQQNKDSKSHVGAGDSAQNATRSPSKEHRLLRPILPRERSAFDRLLDALVGDGPDRRFALICQQCASHNGMALQEEFEYLAFRCCYCGYLNPARNKRRPTAEPANLAPLRTPPPFGATVKDVSVNISSSCPNLEKSTTDSVASSTTLAYTQSLGRTSSEAVDTSSALVSSADQTDAATTN